MGYSYEQLGFCLFFIIFAILSIHKTVAKYRERKKNDSLNIILKQLNVSEEKEQETNDNNEMNLSADDNGPERQSNENTRNDTRSGIGGSIKKYTNGLNSFRKKISSKLHKELHYIWPTHAANQHLKSEKMVLNYCATFNNRYDTL
jgi:hypothetical protein